MLKWAPLIFLLFLCHTGRAQAYTTADTILSAGDTLVASFHLADTTIGDTTYFGIDGDHKNEFLGYFQKHLRAPEYGDSVITGKGRVYFVIDKTGRVTQAWYDAAYNTDIGLGALGIINSLPQIRPTSIKGEAVITKVCFNILVVKVDEKGVAIIDRSHAGNFIPDMVENVYPAMH